MHAEIAFWVVMYMEFGVLLQKECSYGVNSPTKTSWTNLGQGI